MKNEKFEGSVIPQEVLDKFFEFLNRNNTTTKKFYEVDEETLQKVQVREVTETRQNDLKATLSLFQTIYPEHFDKLTQERILKAQKDTGSSDAEELEKKIKDGFAIKLG
jgi:hypothetical protein